MSKNTKKKKLKKQICWIIGVIILATVIAIGLWMVFGKENGDKSLNNGSNGTATVSETKNDSNKTSSPEDTVVNNSTGSEQTVDLGMPDGNEEGFAIETEVGTLYYPEQWREYLDTAITSSPDTTSIEFSTTANDMKYVLFIVEIGWSEGAHAGTISSPDGVERDVYLILSELEGMEALSDTDQQRLYAMQEDVNYVIDHLKG